MKTALALLCLLLLAAPAAAQFGDSVLQGVVVDQDGDPLKGASVRAQQVDGGLRVESLCDGRGVYVLRDLPAGRYKVTASLIPHGAASRTVSLGPGQRRRVDFQLRSVSDDAMNPEFRPTPPGFGAAR